MGLSTTTSAVIGAAFVALAGAGALLVAYQPAEPEAPRSNHRDADIPERVIPRKEKRVVVPTAQPPAIEEAEEVIVISESPINYEYTRPAPTLPPGAGEKVQYFGDVNEKTVRSQSGKATSRFAGHNGAALAWLTEHQNADGSWRPDKYFEDSKRGRAKGCESSADPDTRVSVTALALWAMGLAAPSAKPDTDAIAAGVRYLQGKVGADGWLEFDSPHGVLTQALAAWVLMVHAPKEPSTLDALEALKRARIVGSGWPRAQGGASADAFVTWIAHGSIYGQLDKNERASLMGEIARLKEGDANAGLWANGSEPAAALLRTCLGGNNEDMKRARADVVKRIGELPAEDSDLLYVWAAVPLFNERDTGNPGALALQKHLRAQQCGFRDAEREKGSPEDNKGSWDPGVEFASTGGRVATTALALATLAQLDHVDMSEPRKTKDRDKDKDDSPDTPELTVSETICALGPTLLARRESGLANLPLQGTNVEVEISGVFAAAGVTQTYTNPYKEVIEVVYCFPLPHGAAITDFVLTVGSRTIRGVIRERAEAELVYSDAIARGQTAALLNRETGNVFNHYIGNIEPDAKLTVSLGLFERVKVEAGLHEWVMPLVVGPYYIAGAPVETEPDPKNRVKGRGVEPDTDRVPNASRITPPALPEGVESPNKVELSVDLRAGRTITELASVAHEISIQKPAADHWQVTLAKPEIADRDFILQWRVEGDWQQPAVHAHRADGDGYFSLTLAPPAKATGTAAREITFIMDISGSMSGQPIDCSKQLVLGALDELTPSDKFNVFFFSGGNGQVFESPQEATPQNVELARLKVAGFEAGGGTEMLKGLQRALEATHDDRYVQTYAFLTDGYVGETEAILSYVQKYGDKVQFFAFGVGYSVNRDLIDGIAESANGRAIYYVPSRNAALDLAPIETFLGSIRGPVASAPRVDWGTLPVFDVSPSAPGAVYVGQVLTLTGRYRAAASGTVRVAWTVDGVEQWMEVPVTLPEVEEANGVLENVWAAEHAHDLELAYRAEPQPETLQALIDLALAQGLSTRWTSFVAVDETRTVGTGKPKTISQPVEIPKGVDRKQVGR